MTNSQQKQKKLEVRKHERGFGKVIWRKKQRPCYFAVQEQTFRMKWIKMNVDAQDI